MGRLELKLKELLILFRNGASIKQFEGAEGLPITRIETIADATINISRVGYADIFDDKYNDYYLKQGDILLSHINSVKHLGKCAICENIHDEIIHGMNLLMLRANSEKIVPKYLYYVLNSTQFKVQLPKITKKSVNQASMTVTDLVKLVLQIETDLNKQQKIVDVLDKADEIRTKKKLANNKLNEFLKSTFIDMFGDPVKNDKDYPIKALQDSTIFLTDGKHGDCNDEENSGFYFVSAKCINNGKIDLNQARQIKFDDFQEVNKRVKINVGDLLIVNTGATIGKMAIVRNEELASKITLQKSVAVINIDNKVLNAEYLSHCMFFKSISNVSAGSAIHNLLLSTMRAYKFPTPPIEEQNKFAEIVEKAEEQKQKNERIIEQMDNLFNALSQKAFKREL